MKCKDCVHAKKRGQMAECTRYGLIIGGTHDCKLPGARYQTEAGADTAAEAEPELWPEGWEDREPPDDNTGGDWIDDWPDESGLKGVRT